MLEKVRMARRLSNRKVTSLKKELEGVINRQSALAEKIVTHDDGEGSLDKELVELNQKKIVLEAKINAFDTNKAGFMEPSKRADFLAILEVYDAIEYRGNNLDDLIQLQTNLNELLEKVNEVINLEGAQSQNARSEKAKKGFERLKDKAFKLFAGDDSLDLIKKYLEEKNKGKVWDRWGVIDRTVKSILIDWLNQKENISFEKYIPMYLENERLKNEEWQREQDERKLREHREREKRNAEAMAAAEVRLGGGYFF